MMDEELERKAFEHAMHEANYGAHPPGSWIGWKLAMKHLRESKDNPATIDPQKAEFDAVDHMVNEYHRVCSTPIVDDDYPQVRAGYESAVRALIDAMRINHRFPDSPFLMTENQLRIHAELKRATEKFPTWPNDPLHAIGMVNEEVGELNKAILQAVYEPSKNQNGRKDVAKEAVQAAAMLMRFIGSLYFYDYAPSIQHRGPA